MRGTLLKGKTYIFNNKTKTELQVSTSICHDGEIVVAGNERLLCVIATIVPTPTATLVQDRLDIEILGDIIITVVFAILLRLPSDENAFHNRPGTSPKDKFSKVLEIVIDPHRARGSLVRNREEDDAIAGDSFRLAIVDDATQSGDCRISLDGVADVVVED